MKVQWLNFQMMWIDMLNSELFFSRIYESSWSYEGIGPINELWEQITFLDTANQGSRCGTDLDSTPRHIATMNEFTETSITKERLRKINATIPSTLYTVEQLSIKRRNQAKRHETIHGRMLDALDAGEPYEGLYGKIVDEMQHERQEESE